MKVLGSADAMVKKLNDRAYHPSKVTTSGKNYTLLAEKDCSRFKSFFNLKLLFSHPKSWGERVFLGKKIIKYTGTGDDLANINGKLVSSTNQTALFNLLPDSKPVKINDSERLALAEGPRDLVCDNNEKNRLINYKALLKKAAINPHSIDQPLVDKIEKLNLNDTATLSDFFGTLTKAIAKHEDSDADRRFKVEFDGDDLTIHLKTKGSAEYPDCCLLGEDRIGLDYHALKELVERNINKKDLTVFATYAGS